MKYLITGFSGQLGFDVVKELKSRGVKDKDILAVSSKEMNITDKKDVFDVVKRFKPSVIIHCAAWTKVDDAEDYKNDCFNVNVNGTKNLIEAAKDVDASIIIISSDYVFNGEKDGIYTEEDKTCPQNVYGKSKELAEKAALKYKKSFVVRTSWVFGINGKNFVKTMIRLGKEKDELNIVSDQVGSPTYTIDLAKFLVDLADTDKYGIYHATNEEYCSWAEFAKYIFKTNGIKIKVNEVPTSEYKQKATRPLNSRLSKDKLENNGFDRFPSWQNAIDRYNIELKKEGVLNESISNGGSRIHR